MLNNEKLIEANGVELCVETFGASHPRGVCLDAVVAGRPVRADRRAGRFLIRFDNRDTGRSVSYPAGRPEYSLTDLAADAMGILDVLGIDRAHIVGRSMGGAIALVASVDHAERVASTTFVCTTPGDADLPPMSDDFLARAADGADYGDPEAVVRHVVDLMKAYVGDSPYFDEHATRALAEQDVARTKDMASSLSNHFAINFDGPKSGGLGDIAVPALVVHGELDPVFPLPHGKALARAIPGANLLILEDTGHDVPALRYGVFIDALGRHTGRGFRMVAHHGEAGPTHYPEPVA